LRGRLLCFGKGETHLQPHGGHLAGIEAVLPGVAIAFRRAGLPFQPQIGRLDSLTLISLGFRLGIDPRFLLRDFRHSQDMGWKFLSSRYVVFP
jgi:hypothetical protein